MSGGGGVDIQCLLLHVNMIQSLCTGTGRQSTSARLLAKPPLIYGLGFRGPTNQNVADYPGNPVKNQYSIVPCIYNYIYTVHIIQNNI